MRHLFIFYYNLIENIWHLVRLKYYFYKNIKLDKPIYFDVGSHKGKFLNLFKKIYPNGAFFCFEPNVIAYEYLIQNFFHKKNKFFNLAVGSRNEIKKMMMNSFDLSNSLSKINFNSKYLKFKNFILSTKKKDLIKRKKIKVIKLDTFCLKNHIKKIDILKIDVEGFELQVLIGANKILANTNYIIIEIQNNKMYLNYSKKKIEILLKKRNLN